MVSVALMSVWGVLDFFLLAAGGLTLAFSFIWRGLDPIRNLAMSQGDLTFGMVLGIFYLLTFMVSVGAVIQQNHVTIGLIILNWLLILDTILTVIFGSTLWFRTLDEQKNFEKVWIGARPEARMFIQDTFSCCGYQNNTDVQLGGTTCPSVEATANIEGCVRQFTGATDFLLNATFTTVYSFTAITVGLFITTLCVMKKRQEQERFRKIDAKRGGRGFV